MNKRIKKFAKAAEACDKEDDEKFVGECGAEFNFSRMQRLWND